MSMLTISASEAFLIGCFVEEYQQATIDADDVYFVEFVPDRLARFFPHFHSEEWNCTEILREDIPANVKWIEFLNRDRTKEIKVARSPQKTNVLFIDSGAVCKKLSFPTPRRSLNDLLIDYLRDALGMSSSDNYRYPPGGDEATAFLANMENMFAVEDASRTKDYDVVLHLLHRESDDSAAIRTKIDELVHGNKCKESYAVGTIFGRMLADSSRQRITVTLADCDLFPLNRDEDQKVADDEDAVINRIGANWNFISPGDFEDRRIEAVNLLLEHEDFECCWTAAGALKRSVESPIDTVDGEVLPCRLFSLEKWDNLIWFAIGQYAASLFDADFDWQITDRQYVVPRQFRNSAPPLKGTSSLANVDAWIHLVEDRMFDTTDPGLRPDSVINQLAPAIEAMTREAWPEDPAWKQKPTRVTRLLKTHLHGGTDQENRFAEMALMLYKHFRNDSAHADTGRKFTWEEAKAMFVNVRLLRHWLSQI
jgi:hypothetical protein